MKHLIDVQDLGREGWDSLYRSFKDILTHPEAYSSALQGCSMASLFFEPSTRTRFSFEAAMHHLGGGVFGFADPASTSMAKGETLKDTIIMVSGYADMLVMRHYREGAALAASQYASCPVINAGDGGHCHPTQTLTDLATLTHLRGAPDGIRIGLCGDLKNGRTIHSLLSALCWFDNVHVHLISPRELAIPPYLRKTLQERGLRLYEAASLEATIAQLDALYMTRIQKERFTNPAEYERLKGLYVLTPAKLRAARKDMLVLHPLPRVDEIRPDVDSDPRAVYFQQARYGMYVRMALLLQGKKASITPPLPKEADTPHVCQNPRCITADEAYLPPLVTGGTACAYCETEFCLPPNPPHA